MGNGGAQQKQDVLEDMLTKGGYALVDGSFKGDYAKYMLGSMLASSEVGAGQGKIIRGSGRVLVALAFTNEACRLVNGALGALGSDYRLEGTSKAIGTVVGAVIFTTTEAGDYVMRLAVDKKAMSKYQIAQLQKSLNAFVEQTGTMMEDIRLATGTSLSAQEFSAEMKLVMGEIAKKNMPAKAMTKEQLTDEIYNGLKRRNVIRESEIKSVAERDAIKDRITETSEAIKEGSYKRSGSVKSGFGYRKVAEEVAEVEGKSTIWTRINKKLNATKLLKNIALLGGLIILDEILPTRTDAYPVASYGTTWGTQTEATLSDSQKGIKEQYDKCIELIAERSGYNKVISSGAQDREKVELDYDEAKNILKNMANPLIPASGIAPSSADTREARKLDEENDEFNRELAGYAGELREAIEQGFDEDGVLTATDAVNVAFAKLIIDESKAVNPDLNWSFQVAETFAQSLPEKYRELFMKTDFYTGLEKAGEEESKKAIAELETLGVKKEELLLVSDILGVSSKTAESSGRSDGDRDSKGTYPGFPGPSPVYSGEGKKVVLLSCTAQPGALSRSKQNGYVIAGYDSSYAETEEFKRPFPPDLPYMEVGISEDGKVRVILELYNKNEVQKVFPEVGKPFEVMVVFENGRWDMYVESKYVSEDIRGDGPFTKVSGNEFKREKVDAVVGGVFSTNNGNLNDYRVKLTVSDVFKVSDTQ